MKKLFENFRRYSEIEELSEQFNVLVTEKKDKMAKARAELALIQKDPQAYIKQRTAKLQKKTGASGDAAGGGETKDVLLKQLKDEEGEQKQDAAKLQQVDKLGDQAIAQAQKDPEQKPLMQQITRADKAVNYIMDLVQEVRDKIFKEFQDAMSKGDVAKMKERKEYFTKFGDFSSKFIQEAVEAFKKGSEDPKQYDEVVAMAAKYGFKG